MRVVAGAVVELRQGKLGAEVFLGQEHLVVGQRVDQRAIDLRREGAARQTDRIGVVVELDVLEFQHGFAVTSTGRRLATAKIGRASCRERVGQYVEISVVAVSLKKKNIKKNQTQ